MQTMLDADSIVAPLLCCCADNFRRFGPLDPSRLIKRDDVGVVACMEKTARSYTCKGQNDENMSMTFMWYAHEGRASDKRLKGGSTGRTWLACAGPHGGRGGGLLSRSPWIQAHISAVVSLRGALQKDTTTFPKRCQHPLRIGEDAHETDERISKAGFSCAFL